MASADALVMTFTDEATVGPFVRKITEKNKKAVITINSGSDVFHKVSLAHSYFKFP